jgi:hypothetical protein
MADESLLKGDEDQGNQVRQVRIVVFDGRIGVGGQKQFFLYESLY